MLDLGDPVDLRWRAACMLRYFSLAKLRAQLLQVKTGLLDVVVVVVVFAGLKPVRLLVSSGAQNVQSQLSLLSRSAAPCWRWVTSASHWSRWDDDDVVTRVIKSVLTWVRPVLTCTPVLLLLSFMLAAACTARSVAFISSATSSSDKSLTAAPSISMSITDCCCCCCTTLHLPVPASANHWHVSYEFRHSQHSRQ